MTEGGNISVHLWLVRYLFIFNWCFGEQIPNDFSTVQLALYLIGVWGSETPFIFCLVWSVLLYTIMGTLRRARARRVGARLCARACVHALCSYFVDHIGLAWQLYNGPFSCYITCFALRMINDKCLKFKWESLMELRWQAFFLYPIFFYALGDWLFFFYFPHQLFWLDILALGLKWQAFSI